MGEFLAIVGLFVAYAVMNDHEGAYTQDELVGVGFAALLIIVGAIVYTRKD